MKKHWFLLLSICGVLSLLNVNAQSDDKRVLFTVAGQPVYVNEFNYVYTKNNINNTADFSEKSLREYLDLFTKFRLKVRQAEDLKLDTIESLKSELGVYRKQLAKNYLQDKEVYDNLEKEAYERMQSEVKVSHILVKVAPDASPADTLAAYKKIMDYRKQAMKKGSDFNMLAKALSEDPSARSNSGNLGYTTVFQMIYPFENATYSTPVGEVSMPFRTRFGYHIIKVMDKRPARGQVNVAHIVVTVPEKALFNADSASHFKVQKIYNDIKSGSITFEQAVTEFSDDKKTKLRNGELGWFGTGKMNEAFEDVAFGLKNKGDIGGPIRTPYGWHIIKLIDRKPIPPFSEIKNELKTKIDRDSRSEMSRSALVNKIKAKYGSMEYLDARKEVFAMVDSSIVDGKWIPGDTKNMSKPVFKIGDQVSNQQDLAGFMAKNQKPSKNRGGFAGHCNYLYEEFVEAKCLDLFEKKLDEEYPDFRMLMKEYRDGILLFELTDRQVWSKAVKDTNGLKAFYETIKDKYKWGNRASVDIYNCTDLAIANEARKWVGKKKTPAEIMKALNKEGSKSKVTVISGKYEKGQYDLIDKVDWTPGIKPNIVNADSSITFVNFKEVVNPEPKTLNEAKGYIVSEYQEYLEKQWVSDLRAKYPIVINEEVLKSLIKK